MAVVANSIPDSSTAIPCATGCEVNESCNVPEITTPLQPPPGGALGEVEFPPHPVRRIKTKQTSSVALRTVFIAAFAYTGFADSPELNLHHSNSGALASLYFYFFFFPCFADFCFSSAE